MTPLRGKTPGQLLAAIFGVCIVIATIAIAIPHVHNRRESFSPKLPEPAPHPTFMGPTAIARAAKITFSDTPIKGKSFRNTVGAGMVWISPGTFLMGDPSGSDSDKATPAHKVRLSTGFWLGESVVTQAQWYAEMGSKPRKQLPVSGNAAADFQGAELPVENVNWYGAMDYCRKLTKQEHATGKLPADIDYRLPTEAEWEFACRAGTKGLYEGDLDAMAWYSSNSGDRLHPVMTKRPNAWGLYDMHGNVYEWCLDWYDTYTSFTQVDPVGLKRVDPTGIEFIPPRVIRGGSWNSSAQYCRSTARLGSGPDYRYNFLGFRLAAVTSNRIHTDLPDADDGIALGGAEHRSGEERAVEIANGIKLTLCWIPAGTFVMSSQVSVRISQGFWMAKTECTQKQWTALMSPSYNRFQGENLPMDSVHWSDATRYCHVLTERQHFEGTLPSTMEYRLPTEAEWEYACRAGTEGQYAGDLDAMAWYASTGDDRTHPVGSKKANAWGLMDMYGNVSEWCADEFKDKLPGGTDPFVETGSLRPLFGFRRPHPDPSGLTGALRVARGGSWFSPAESCQSGARDYGVDQSLGGVPPEPGCVGFRVVAVQTTAK